MSCFLEGIFIFDAFFIGLSNVIIGFFLNMVDLALSFHRNIENLFNNSSNRLDTGNIKNLFSGRFGDWSDENGMKQSSNIFNNQGNENMDNQSSGLFSNGGNENSSSGFFSNVNIFEELENRYSKNSSNQHEDVKFANGSTDIRRADFDENLKKDFFKELMENRNMLNFNSLMRIGGVIFCILIIVVLFISYFISFEMGLVILGLFALLTIAILYLPQIKKQNHYSQFSKELPYALRQLATELRSGKSLFDSIDSVVDADYGILSIEFSRLLREVRYGESTENAFIHLNSRVKSKGLSRASSEILSTLRVGGNLSNSLSIIAEDMNFDMRMKLREYSQKLNAFIMIYTFLAILAPVILLTLLLAASVVMGDIVPANLILVLYGLFFPMIIVFLGFFIKKLEPNV